VQTKNIKRFVVVGLIVIICGFFVWYIVSSFFNKIEYTNTQDIVLNEENKDSEKVPTITPNVSNALVEIPVTHIQTPEHVRSIYLSSWTAGAKKYFDPLVKLADETEINSMVIDVKDSTGRIGFNVSNPELQKYGSAEKRISDIRAVTNLLHQKNIYIIGRVSVFQDPFMTKLKPEWSITRKSDGKVWKDRKGLSFLDPANIEVRKYIVAIALEAYKQGFDEINFDYIRYPSDGNMKDINYRLEAGKTRADNIEEFFKYLSLEVKKDQNIPISGDLFGLTTQTNDDMGIGQVWEKALPYFDYLAPMVYPSHYPPGQNGYKNPSLYPYEIVNTAMIGAVNKTKKVNQNIAKIRPWLQDFDLGAVYTKDMVKAQMKAVYDNGLNSWMLWDPTNKYTPTALELEKTQ
jgi:hypothetical protein